MAYKVIKWVKGHAYAYLQRSFREGSTVRTVSEYLGPVDPANAPKKGAKAQMDRKGADSGPPPSKARKKAVGGERPPSDSPTSETKAKEGKKAVRAVAEERIRIDSRLAKKGLSERVARRHHKNMIAHLAALGIPSDNVPRVIARYGSKLAVKPHWRGGFVVTVPRFDRVKHADVRAAFRLALGRATLEALRTQKPELFGRLSLAMDSCFQDTNAALLSYVRAGGHPEAWTWSLCVRFLGYANPLPGRTAEEVGLVGYGARKNWKDEAAGMIGKLVSSGHRATFAEVEREEKRAKAAEKSAFEAIIRARGIMGRIERPELRRRLRVASARIRATRTGSNNIRTAWFFLSGEGGTDEKQT